MIARHQGPEQYCELKPPPTVPAADGGDDEGPPLRSLSDEDVGVVVESLVRSNDADLLLPTRVPETAGADAISLSHLLYIKTGNAPSVMHAAHTAT